MRVVGNWPVERSDGTREDFAATCRVEMNTGDVFVIQTPGGGGFGAPAHENGETRPAFGNVAIAGA